MVEAPTGWLDECTTTQLAGWARLAGGGIATIEIVLDGARIGACVADRPRADLAAAGLGDGRHGFVFRLPPGMEPDGLAGLEVVVAGTGCQLSRAGAVWRQRFFRPPGARRFARCVLHIGTEKAGSTSLQRMLWDNHAVLAGAGRVVPRCLAPHARLLNHEDLPLIGCGQDPRVTDLAGHTTMLAAGPAFRAHCFAALEAEVAAAGPGDTLVLSSEHCHSRVTDAASVAAIRDFLSPFCERFEIVVYLRAQHALAASRHGMALMLGKTEAALFPALREGRGDWLYYDYARLLGLWEGVFGAAALRPRLVRLCKAGVAADFAALLGLAEGSVRLGPDVGGNVSGAALAFLARLYGTVEVPMGRRLWISEQLRRISPGRGAGYAAADAAAFMAPFAAGNEQVRARWFAEHALLFDPPADANAAAEADDAAMYTMLLELVQAAASR